MVWEGTGLEVCVVGVACDTNGCVHNDGNGFCEMEDIYISDAETGEPICQNVEFENERE